MIPVQKGEPGFRKNDHYWKHERYQWGTWTASYDDIRYITAHETADMLCQILSGDGVYYGLGQYISLYREYQPEVFSKSRPFPKGKESNPEPKPNPYLKEMGFDDNEVARIMDATTVIQRKAIRYLVSLGLKPKDILEQMKL